MCVYVLTKLCEQLYKIKRGYLIEVMKKFLIDVYPDIDL